MPTKRNNLKQLSVEHKQNIGRLLLRAARDFAARASTQMCTLGYPGLQMGHAALLANLDLEGTRVGVLAERAGMTKQAMGQLVKELEDNGYLKRRPDPTDRRATIATPTKAGLQLLVDVQEVVEEIEGEYAHVLGGRNLQLLRSSLARLAAHAPPE